MMLKILNDEGTTTVHTISKETIVNSKPIDFISSTQKETNVLKIIDAYYSGNKTILFDSSNKAIVDKVKNFDLNLLNTYDFSMMFFTSGSTGNPVGALKTKNNLEEEVKVFSKLIENYNIKQVIVTVPFIHIYGTLVGLLYPLLNNIDIVLKEHFLPFNLLETIKDNSLIVTTPLYIESLLKTNENLDMKTSLFVSSTAPLSKESAKQFSQKFNTNVMQLFGSTETSGIGYKYNDDELWTPFENVTISVNQENELIVQSPFVSEFLYENDFKSTSGLIQTFDYIEQYENKFKLIGRSSKIFKVAGKRYSTVQIETILENIDGISKALVFVSHNDLNNEFLDILLETTRDFSTLEIKQILREQLSNLKFPLQLKFVDKIAVNSVGKKLKIN